MASLLSIMSLLDDLDGQGTGTNLLDIIRHVTRWEKRPYRTETRDGFLQHLWKGEYPGATVSFSTQWYSFKPNPGLEEIRSQIEITSEEAGKTQSVLRFRRGFGWDQFGLATAQLSFQSADGEWRHNALGYPHPTVYNAAAIRFTQSWDRMMGQGGLPEIFGPQFKDGAIRAALHYLEIAADLKSGDLGHLPSDDRANQKIMDAVRRWREKRDEHKKVKQR